MSRLRTVPLEKARRGIGVFGDQNIVRNPTTPTWRTTVERLQENFPGLDT